jgi:hypothetical protein
MGNRRISCKSTLAMLVISFNVLSSVAFANPEKPSEGFGEWRLQTLNDGKLVTLEYEQWIPLSGNAVDTASFGFLCYKRSGSTKVDARVNPFKGYGNQQDELFVLIKSAYSEKYTLGQKWRNGCTSIFLNQIPEVEKLVNLLVAAENHGEKALNIFSQVILVDDRNRS